MSTRLLEDVTDEQRSKTYKCSCCGWTGKIEEMDGAFDRGDEWDAIYSPFCCPNEGCWAWYLFLEDWEAVSDRTD